MNTPRHVPALDGLRALAILLVIPHNANMYGDHPGLFQPLAMLANAGWTGVQLFFVLSGFLITGGLLDTVGQRGYFSRFYLRRALRILPLYYAVLLIGWIAGPALIGHPPLTPHEAEGVPWLWLFLSNWVQPFGAAVPGFTHFWSLAVEEQFYLLWPLAVLACSRRGLAWLCATLMVLAMVARLALPRLGLPDETSYVFTVCRMDALAAGALAALALRSDAWRRRCAPRLNLLSGAAVTLLALGALTTRLYDRHDWRTLCYGEPLLAVAFATLVLVAALAAQAPSALAASPAWTRWLAARPLRHIGRYSYGMYVLHLPLALALAAPAHRWLQGAGQAEPPLFALLVTTSSLLAGWASYMLLERHCLALKSRLNATAAGVRTSTTDAAP